MAPGSAARNGAQQPVGQCLCSCVLGSLHPQGCAKMGRAYGPTPSESRGTSIFSPSLLALPVSWPSLPLPLSYHFQCGDQPGLSGLSWRFGVKGPNSSCLIWTALDSSCLKASRVGKGADLLECCPALPFTGNLLFPPLVSPTLRREGSVSNPAPGAQLGFAGGLAVLGLLHHVLGCECQGLGLQERCSLLGSGEGAD